jgi:hypothetical protein
VRLRGALEPDPIDAEAAVFGDQPSERMLLRSGMEMALSATSDGPPVATLRVPEGYHVVSVYETRGGRSRIGWELEKLLIFGWISVEGLMPSPRGRSRRSSPPPFEGMPIEDVPIVDEVWCGMDIPVIAGEEGQRVTVGRIHGSSVISIFQWNQELSRIWWYRPLWMDENPGVRFAWLVPAENAALLGRSSDLRKCISLRR